jgi:hypothetical protein
MPNLKDVKQQLTEWQHSHTRVILLFRDSAFNLLLDGKIQCDSHGRDFEFMTEAGAFSPPRLSEFRVVGLGPDPEWHNRTTIKLRRRRRRSEITLIEAAAAEASQAGTTGAGRSG